MEGKFRTRGRAMVAPGAVGLAQRAWLRPYPTDFVAALSEGESTVILREVHKIGGDVHLGEDDIA